MKNIPNNTTLYDIKTPVGADYITCPVCKDFFPNEVENILDFGINLYLYYAPCCNILFNISHTHIPDGCTDGSYYSHFVTKYQTITYDTNNIKTICDYIGQPQFVNVEECILMFFNNQIRILELGCSCNKCIIKIVSENK
jgi:hypothetical protein